MDRSAEGGRFCCKFVCATTVRHLKIIILCVLQHDSENWSLIIREEHRLRVFENRVMRRIFGLKMEKITGSLRNLHKDKLQNLHILTHY
jgi:hypothetical protein